MLSALTPYSTASLVALGVALALVLLFEFSNGFHDTANAVATVIYTHSLKPVPAVILSGVMNFSGVLLGGVAVAYTLVELLPPDVLSPPNGNPAIAMLFALFASALFWNVGTWLLGIPCSSSHAVVGSLLGVGIANSILAVRGLGHGVDWGQVWSVMKALLFSPVLGFAGAWLLFHAAQLVLGQNKALFRPANPNSPPVWWVRGLLILTCSGVSFTHGSNDGQKSIGLIMLTIIGLFPAVYALNMGVGPDRMLAIAQAAEHALPLIQQHGDDEKGLGADAAQRLADRFHGVQSMQDVPERDRIGLRNDVYRVTSELKTVTEATGLPDAEKAAANESRSALKGSVEYAPTWVRVISALCLGIGTMVGYKRIVTTIGEKIGKTHLTPAQGASAELVAGVLIGTAGFSGLPVSTTHILSSGVAGTMTGSGAGLQGGTVRNIILAWVLTLPVTILLSGLLYYVLAG